MFVKAYDFQVKGTCFTIFNRLIFLEFQSTVVIYLMNINIYIN